MESSADDRQILLLHDGELADVASLLTQLGLHLCERRGTPTLEDLQAAWDLVVGTPRRLLENDSLRGQGVHIAVTDEDSRTLRATLKRSGIDFTVRRPVHPAALRLLILHSLYRGPEKRRARRVSVGAPIRLRVGLRRRSVILADLSHTGCRLITPRDLQHAEKVRIQLGSELTGGRPLNVKGRVLRNGPAAYDADGNKTLAVSFDPLSSRQAGQLAAVVSRFGAGPAVFEALRETLAAVDQAPECLPVGAADSAAVAKRERRRSDRHEIARHVISLDGEAARVLMGRDISMGGMRVDRHPGLTVGAEVQLALHVRAREAPLVLRARVHRDDGEAGLLLVFCALEEAARSYLEKMVKFLPILARRSGDGEQGVIVSEILEAPPT